MTLMASIALKDMCRSCLVTATLGARKPVTVLFDDDTKRAQYHGAERVLKPAGVVGRLVRFEVNQNMEVAPHLTRMIGRFTQMQLAELRGWDVCRYLRRQSRIGRR